MAARLKTPRKYKGKPFGIPFTAVDGQVKSYKLKLKVAEEELKNQQIVIQQAFTHYITHYFPEFYPALADMAAFEALDGDATVFSQLKEDLIGATTIESTVDTAPPSKKKVVIFKLAQDVYRTREELRKDLYYTAPHGLPKIYDQMPSFVDSLAFFNADMGYGPTVSQTSFDIKSLPAATANVQETLKKMGKQRNKRSAPQLPETVDFDFLERSIGKVMAMLITQVTEAIKGDSKTYKILEGDMLTLYFGLPVDEGLIAGPKKPKLIPNQVITDIKFLAPDRSLAEQHLKVGQFSIVKYGHLLTDKLVVSSVKNYEPISRMGKKASKSGGTFSLDEFFSDAFNVDTTEGLPLNWNPVESPGGPQDDHDNPLINLATDLGVIDVADTAALQYSMGAYTSTQLASITDTITRNPAVFAEVFETERYKREETAPDFLDKIEQALLEGPLAAVDENSPAGAFFRHFGITTLVKEALLCLTFGLNFEIARIVDIISQLKDTIEHGNISVEFGGSVKGITKPQIPLPSLGNLSLSFPMFTITGDLWKMIIEIVIESLEKALLQVIQQLVELLRQLCDFNNPRSRDYGDKNIRDFLPDDRATEPLGSRGTRAPDMSGQYGPFDPFAGTNLEDPSGEGFTPDAIFDYVSKLSALLSSLDICILLTEPAAATEDLLEKILEFNKEYADENVSKDLVTFTAIVGFFKELARIADVTKLCNEIANEVVTVNQDNFCLTEEDLQTINLDDSENIETLLEILEKGLVPGGAGGVPEVIRPNLECPDSPNYIEDPTFRKSVYETMNALAEVIELQFGYSSESIKSALLDARLSRAGGGPDGGASWQAITAALGPDPLPAEYTKPPDKGIIDGLKAMMNGMKDAQAMSDQIQACINENQDLVNANASVNIDVIYEAMQLIIEGLEIGFAAGGKIDSLLDGLENASAAAADSSASGAPLINTKVFNRSFYKQFINYIDFDQKDAQPLLTNSAADMPNTAATFKVPQYFESNAVASRGEIVPLAGSAATLNLEWSFPSISKMPAGQAQPPRQRITAEYPGYQIGSDGAYSYNLGQLFKANDARATATSALLSHNLNNPKLLDLDEFVASVLDSLVYGVDIPNNDATFNTLPTLTDGKIKYALRRVFPAANALLTDYIFDYYIENGIFDAATLQSLNFFHNNENCQPGDVADLLDVDGIIGKMIAQFEMLACSKSKLPARKKLRLAIKYGMYLLFVQVHIAELILKNVFVFSALELDELFSQQFIAIFMRDQIQASMSNYLNTLDVDAQTMFNHDLVSMFNEFVEIEGGVVNQNGDVVFPAGENIELNSTAYNKILVYLIDERIYDSRTAVNNALRQAHPGAKPKSMEEIFLSSIPAYRARSERPTDVHQMGEPWFERLKRIADLGAVGSVNGVIQHASVHAPGFEAFGSHLDPDAANQGPAADRTLTADHPRLFVVKTYGTPIVDELQAQAAAIPPPASNIPDAADNSGPPTTSTGGSYGVDSAQSGPAQSVYYSGPPTTSTGGSYGVDSAQQADEPWQEELAPETPPASEQPNESTYPAATDEQFAIPGMEVAGYDVDDAAQDLTVWEQNSLGTPARPSVDFLVRYRFYLYLPDPGSLAGEGNVYQDPTFMRLYALFPRGNRGPGTPYAQQVKTLDRIVTFTSPEDPDYRNIINLPVAGMREEPLTPDDMQWILTNPEYQEYFSTVFDRGLLGVVPLIHNFYLTNIHFTEIGSAMNSTKDACLSVVREAIASDDKYDKTPDMSRQVASQFKNSTGASNAFDSFARDFIIMVLVQMPVEILKSILELIDPHVALSKLIRTITGQIFNQLSRIFDEILSTVEGPIKDLIGSGEDLLTMVLCLMDVTMKNPAAGPNATPTTTAQLEAMEAFFPRITKEGIDFVGSIMGMFMIPPSPLGILYLLLSLINVEPQEFGANTGETTQLGDTSTINSTLPPNPTDC